MIVGPLLSLAVSLSRDERSANLGVVGFLQLGLVLLLGVAGSNQDEDQHNYEEQRNATEDSKTAEELERGVDRVRVIGGRFSKGRREMVRSSKRDGGLKPNWRGESEKRTS